MRESARFDSAIHDLQGTGVHSFRALRDDITPREIRNGAQYRKGAESGSNVCDRAASRENRYQMRMRSVGARYIGSPSTMPNAS